MTKYQITYELEAENLNDATTVAHLLLFGQDDVDIDSVYVAPLPCTCVEPEPVDPLDVAFPTNPMTFNQTIPITYTSSTPNDLMAWLLGKP